MIIIFYIIFILFIYFICYIKKPEISTMTHEEEEEMQHNISNLRDQVQQISLSQKVTKNDFEAMMNVNIGGIKRDMEFF